MKILQVVDVTDYIFYTEFKAKNEFTSLINACVSHELRNPLNSIIAKNIQKNALYQELYDQLCNLSPENRSTQAFKECMSILGQLNDGKKVQQNAAQMMSFMVQDLLDYSQIKAGKFRQNYSVFDIKDTIDKVMGILRQKADEKNIKFFATYQNLGIDQEAEESTCLINCDEHRIMQVLLGLLSNALKFTD